MRTATATPTAVASLSITEGLKAGAVVAAPPALRQQSCGKAPEALLVAVPLLQVLVQVQMGRPIGLMGGAATPIQTPGQVARTGIGRI